MVMDQRSLKDHLINIIRNDQNVIVSADFSDSDVTNLNAFQITINFLKKTESKGNS